jgi:hypothetical protein
VDLRAGLAVTAPLVIAAVAAWGRLHGTPLTFLGSAVLIGGPAMIYASLYPFPSF